MRTRLLYSVFFGHNTHLVFGDATLTVVLESQRLCSKLLDVDVICLKDEGRVGSFWMRMSSETLVSSVPHGSSI